MCLNEDRVGPALALLLSVRLPFSHLVDLSHDAHNLPAILWQHGRVDERRRLLHRWQVGIAIGVWICTWLQGCVTFLTSPYGAGGRVNCPLGHARLRVAQRKWRVGRVRGVGPLLLT